MGREDWIASAVLAAGVALAVVAACLPPSGWAEDAARLTIPSLPPAELKIASLEGTVRATAERKPGEPVIVKLTCECSKLHAGETVPVVVQVFGIDPKSMMSRVYVPSSRQEVARAESLILIDPEGKGTATVELPLTWTPDDADASAKSRLLLGSYHITLTSPLVPGQATLQDLVRISQIEAQGTGR